MRKVGVIVLSMVLIIVLSSCSLIFKNSESADSFNYSNVSNRSYYATKVVGYNPLPSSKLSISFNTNDQVILSTGCGVLTGNADFTDSSLEIDVDNKSDTECDGSYHNQNLWYSKIFKESLKYSFNESYTKLTLSNESIVINYEIG